MKMRAFGSSMTGDISFFGERFDFEQPVSYTVDDGRDDGGAFFKVLHQIEPPDVLNIVPTFAARSGNYDLVLAWNQDVLNSCPGAVLFTESPCSWLPRAKENSVYTPCDVTKKQFAVSFLTSNKNFCPGHKLRVEIYNRIPERVGQIPVHKHMSPPRIPDKRTMLEPFQFHIAPENASHNNWFADKIVDCFIAKTIPLYWGCPNLGNFFNLDGVIRFGSYEELIGALETLTPEYYAAHLAAVEDNYTRALQYVHTWDRIESLIDEGLKKKISKILQRQVTL
jgi:hypothetical protein